MVTLTYGSHTLELRNPDFGNKHAVESRRINRKTRGGDLIIMRDGNWPVTETFSMSFSYLRQSLIPKITEFLKLTLGKQVTLTSYDGTTHSGIILNPTDGLKTVGTDNVQFELQFQEL